MSRIKFIKDSHQYLTEDDRELISVSAFTERFKKKVDWDSVAARVALKERKAGADVSKQDILDRWERKRDAAAEVGTLYHSIREEELLAKQEQEFYDTPCLIKECSLEDGIKYSIPINKLDNNTAYTELMIYDQDNMICGQADKVVVVKNKIHILDYKTDKEIKFNAFSSKWVQPARLLPPLSHLEDCNGNLYSIKMSLYMYMLWKSNRGKLKPGDLILEHVHLERDEDGLPILRFGKPIVKKIEKIKLPYRKKEVIDMLKTINYGS